MFLSSQAGEDCLYTYLNAENTSFWEHHACNRNLLPLTRDTNCIGEIDSIRLFVTSRIIQRGQRKRLPDTDFSRGFLLLFGWVFIFRHSLAVNVSMCFHCGRKDKRLRMYPLSSNRKTEEVYKLHPGPELLPVTRLPPSAPRQLLKHTGVMKLLWTVSHSRR